MSKKMGKRKGGKKDKDTGNPAFEVLDVRPDRVDLRDREYQPALKSLAPVYPTAAVMAHFLPKYQPLVLDQGQEGACTGFGLAAVVNYLQWSRSWRDRLLVGSGDAGLPEPDQVEAVSPRMLYHLARLYDEWPGEDYEGSSCRGAMKGWHRHGVCSNELWPYFNKRGKAKFVEPKSGWQQDAATRPLGAYYRIAKESVADLQAAIFEVGAVFCSGEVHSGWDLVDWDLLTADEDHVWAPDPDVDFAMPIIQPPPPSEPKSGHAFALVGYNEQGFIVQNSWSHTWGYHGFAVLPYSDWVESAMDAWVAVLGAPVANRAGQEIVHDDDLGANPFESVAVPAGASAGSTKRWTGDRAYRHMLVMGNNGQPLNRIVSKGSAAAASRFVCEQRPDGWLSEAGNPKKVVVYCHGGLNSEADSLKRTQIMAPNFLENGAYPIYITWETGLQESISDILRDRASRLPFLRSGGIGDFFKKKLEDVKKAALEASDRAVEAVCEKLVKPIWTQMKQNAEASSQRDAGLRILADSLKNLAKKHPGLEIHLVGHSAGSIMFGHLLTLMRSRKLKVKTLTLYAPACTLGFALKHYKPAIGKVVSAKDVTINVLTDEREQDDNVVKIYNKSLLYLVSRALEVRHKTPLMGMQREWLPQSNAKRLWGDIGAKEVKDWQAFVKSSGLNSPVLTADAQVSDGVVRIPSAHGSFDNDVKVVAATLTGTSGKTVSSSGLNLHGY
jgi:hypothetical protein